MVKDLMTFSIIIPFQSWSIFLDECIEHISRLTFKEFEVILLPDDEIQVPKVFQDLPIRVHVTGKVNPSIKRNLGVSKAHGQYLAFIDDDAYPRIDWLDIGLKVLQDNNIAAVGGPAITPKDDPFLSRVSGAVFLSSFSGGFPERYISCPPTRKVQDWPTVNLIVKKYAYDKTDGFIEKYWPGEDTKFCLDLVLNGFSILYYPELVVYHHRRPKLKNHMRQIGNYGFHRGILAIKDPQTSRKFIYFLPSLFVIFLIGGGILALFHPSIKIIYKVGLVFYGLGMLIALKDILKHESRAVAIASIPYIFLTHLWYGIRFIYGLGNRHYKSSLGR